MVLNTSLKIIELGVKLANVIILSGGLNKPPQIPQLRRSLGPYRIASELNKEGYTSVVIDHIQYLSEEEIISAIKPHVDENTLWMGFSSTFFFAGKSPLTALEKLYQNIPYEKITSIFNYVKDNSKAKIVYGGAYALFPPADPNVDYYVAGYADVSIINLTKHLHKGEPLLSYKEITIEDKQSIVIDSGKYPEPEMNNIETFWHEDSFNLLPNEPVPLEFARGCIFKCKFCNYPLLGKKKGTYIRDMEQVKDEMIKLWETKGTDTFYMTDDTFNDDNEKMEDFHKLFTSLPFKPKFSAFLRLDLINKFPHQADLLLEAGLIGNFFGIETFNWQSAKAIGKGLHPDKVKARLSWVADKWKNKVNIGVGLIIGLPYDDEKYFEELYNYVTSDEYPADHTVYNPLHIYDQRRGVSLYGSEFSMKPEIYGYKFYENGLWYHEEQKIDFNRCKQVADFLSTTQFNKNKISEFTMITYLGLGVKLEDLLTKTESEINAMYDFPKLNHEQLMQYKTMIGAI